MTIPSRQLGTLTFNVAPKNSLLPYVGLGLGKLLNGEKTINFALEARQRTGLTRNAFAKALAISPRTIQEWEQGRREPSGAARSLLRIAHRYPEVIAEVLAQD